MSQRQTDDGSWIFIAFGVIMMVFILASSSIATSAGSSCTELFDQAIHGGVITGAIGAPLFFALGVLTGVFSLRADSYTGRRGLMKAAAIFVVIGVVFSGLLMLSTHFAVGCATEWYPFLPDLPQVLVLF